jgi:hypothetical protein
MGSSVNKMTPTNLAIVFSPILLSPRVDNPLTAMDELKYSKMTLENMIIDRMSSSISTSISLSSRVGHRMTVGRPRGISRADETTEPAKASADVEEIISPVEKSLLITETSEDGYDAVESHSISEVPTPSQENNII